MVVDPPSIEDSSLGGAILPMASICHENKRIG